MARTPTVYRWDDPGAPDLSALHSSNNERDLMYFHTVLKACLVTGYGAKAAAGWTMPHEETTVAGDGNRFVLTNAAGSGSLLYEGGTFSGNSSYRHTDTLWACNSVQDMDAPVNAWSWNVKYADRNSKGSSDVFHKSGSRYKNKATAWVVVANENTCIVVCGRAAYDFSTSNTSSVDRYYSCMFMFGAMHDGFGGVLSPDSGNFYIAGGYMGDYDDDAYNYGVQTDLLTSIQDILGIEKSDSHGYSYKSLSDAIAKTYSSLSAWLPAPIIYHQYGPSSLDGNSSSRLHFAVALPAIRRLLLCPYNISTLNSFMTSNGFEYGKSFTYQGSDWVAFKSYDDIVNVISLDPDEWGV